MRELDPNLLALAMCEFDDLPQRLDLAIFPKAAIFGCDSALCCDGSSFDHAQAWAAQDDAAQVRKVPWCVVAVFGTVLAEGGEHDAVLEGGAAEGEGLEELGMGQPLGWGSEAVPAGGICAGV